MGAVEVREAVAALRDAYASLAVEPVERLTAGDVLEVLDELETLTCQLPTQSHRLLSQLQTEATPQAMGAKTWRDVLAIRWRISTREAGRRCEEAALLGARRTLTGEPMAPLLAGTAAAQTRGAINAEHVTVIRDATARIPGFVDVATREQIEADWVHHAAGVGPKALRDHAERTLFLLDQDGPEPDDAERGRRRGVTMGRQRHDAMTELRATLTPEARVIYEAIFAKWAAPGMCNPADETPCVSGTPSQQQIDVDHRTLAQRQHDALIAAGRSVLESGQLGQHSGLSLDCQPRSSSAPPCRTWRVAPELEYPAEAP